MNRRTLIKHALSTTAALSLPAARLFAEDPGPVVRTRAGSVRGASRDGIASFLGIPYGADTSKRRFQPALPAPAWTGVRDALVWGDRAPQLGGGRPRTRAQQPTEAPETYRLPPDEGASSEDCLHLNVWTPSPRREGHE